MRLFSRNGILTAPELSYYTDETPATDMWWLGCLLYELVTLERPYIGTHPMKLMFFLARKGKLIFLFQVVIFQGFPRFLTTLTVHSVLFTIRLCVLTPSNEAYQRTS